MILGSALQQPNDSLDYDVDYAEFFGLVTDDGISTLTAFVSPEGPTVTAVRSSESVGKLWISGGTPGEYKVTITMRSVRTRVKEDEIILIIKDF